jgi:hypothetical protein
VDRTDVERMTAEELRRAIAIVKGYEWYLDGNCTYLVNDVGRAFISKNAMLVSNPPVSGVWICKSPNWPSRIEYAWGLLEEFVGWNISNEWDGSYTVMIPQYDNGVIVTAPTAPLAISRAWLLARQG